MFYTISLYAAVAVFALGLVYKASAWFRRERSLRVGPSGKGPALSLAFAMVPRAARKWDPQEADRSPLRFEKRGALTSP